MVDSADLIFELGTEELPPKALKSLSTAFRDEFVAGLAQAGFGHGEVTAYATPRRLALLVRALDRRQPDRETERRGPALAAAFDADGKPTKAAEGFARSCGTTVDQLDRLDTDKGTWLAFRRHETGSPATELLPQIAETALQRLPIPKRMRWGDSDAQFVRPVHWLLFVHGQDVVPCTLLDAAADRQTYGHRFHHPDAITLFEPADYAEILEDLGKVIAHFETRRARIEAQVRALAKELGGEPDLDAGLLDEVTALNEWPMPVAATFEARFLDVPHEALVSTMKGNQKYFPLFDADGRLMNHFITIANIDSSDPEVVRTGNERVVRPRLADAMFFWQQDGKRTLADRLDDLKGLVFQQRLGSVYDKTQRVTDLAAAIAGRIGADVDQARRAALLSRCDLMTDMVYEFPDMQGIMGRYQAGRDGEPDAVAVALDEFYLPRFSGDRLPATPVGQAVALADRIDTLVGIFGVGLRPTGDRDPFALRRAALGLLRTIREYSLPISLRELLLIAQEQLAGRIETDDLTGDVEAFLLERLRGIYLDTGRGSDLFLAVADRGLDSVADFDRRLDAVDGFRQLPEAEALAAANKRIGNILRKTDESIPAAPDPALFADAAERRLHQALGSVVAVVEPALDARDYPLALKRMATLRAPVDQFFDEVLVMDEDIGRRRNRLALLSQVQSLFRRVADIGQLHAA